MLWGLMLVGGFVAFVAFIVWQANDRIKHPEKWSKIDAEIRSEQTAKKEREYQDVMKRVSPSSWMRMTKHQKADVLEKREKAARNRKH